MGKLSEWPILKMNCCRLSFGVFLVLVSGKPVCVDMAEADECAKFTLPLIYEFHSNLTQIYFVVVAVQNAS